MHFVYDQEIPIEINSGGTRSGSPAEAAETLRVEEGIDPGRFR